MDGEQQLGGLRLPGKISERWQLSRTAAFSKLLKYIGPAFVVSIAYIDSENSILTHRFFSFLLF